MTSTTRARRRCGGGVLAALVLAATACSNTASTSTNPTATVPAATSTVATTPPSAPPETAPPTTTPPATTDAGTVLQQGITALANGYHFSSVVTVNGAQSLLADGDRIGNTSRLVLTGNGGTVEYIIVAEGSYARPEGGEWSRLDVAPATSDPILALSTPVALAVLPTSDGSVVVRVTVTAVSLGIATDGNVDVDVTLVNGAITQLGYTGAVEGGTAQVVTTIGAVLDPTPIVAPI